MKNNTKFAAFQDRGAQDPRTSHDFEDIVYLLNYTLQPAEQILPGDKEVLEYLSRPLKGIRESDLMQEAVMGHLYFEQRQERFDRIMDQVNKIIQ